MKVRRFMCAWPFTIASWFGADKVGGSGALTTESRDLLDTRPRRWKATAADIVAVVSGGAFVLFGFLATWKVKDTPLLLFGSNALLSVGIAIALVGILLRMQLDVQDELDEAYQARTRFEVSIRNDIAVIDKRVSDAIAHLPFDSETDRDRADRREALVAELADARRRVRELEQELSAARREGRPRRSRLLEPVSVHVQSPTAGGSATNTVERGPNAAAKTRRLRWVLWLPGLAAWLGTSLLVGAGLRAGSFAVTPHAHHVLFSKDIFGGDVTVGLEVYFALWYLVWGLSCFVIMKIWEPASKFSWRTLLLLIVGVMLAGNVFDYLYAKWF